MIIKPVILHTYVWSLINSTSVVNSSAKLQVRLFYLSFILLQHTYYILSVLCRQTFLFREFCAVQLLVHTREKLKKGTMVAAVHALSFALKSQNNPMKPKPLWSRIWFTFSHDIFQLFITFFVYLISWRKNTLSKHVKIDINATK